MVVLRDVEGRRTAGELFPAPDPDGAVAGTGTVVTDVRHLRAAQSELASVHERYRQMFSSTSIGMVLFRAGDKVLEANAAACRMLGYSRAQLLTMHPSELVGGTEAELALRRTRVLQDGLVGYEIEDDLIRSDGRPLPALLTVNTFQDPSGDGHLASVLMRDLSREKELQDRLLRAERLEATGRLAAGIAHDANNILTAVSGYTEMLAEAVAGSRDAQRHLDGIKRSIAKAGEMVSHLLAHTRGVHLSGAPADLADIAVDLEDMLRRLLPADVTLAVHADPAPTEVDGSEIRQVLLNLVVNAGQASPAGGTIRVTTGVHDVGDDDVLLPAGAYACLTVVDEGVGMDEQVARRCFEPFFTTRVADGGSGLGLFTALGIARRSGGDLRTDRGPDRGATFRLLVPVRGAQRPAAVPSGGPASATAPVRRGATRARGAVILLADDDDRVRGLVAEVLRGSGYEVLEASDGRSGLAIGVVPDLLITDVEMPHVGGLELARSLLDRRPGLPVLLVTGKRSTSAHGAFPVLRKPFSIEELLHTVSALVGDAR